MSNEITLLPCPFCGGEAELKRYQSGDWQVICYHADGCIMLESDLDNCYWENVQTLARQWNTRAEHGTLTAEQVRKAVEGHGNIMDNRLYEDWQAVADELNAELWSDNEYEAKMDALLCRLTNGKWSKSRAYDLDFMASCVDEEYEELYEKECAELGNGTCEVVSSRFDEMMDEWCIELSCGHCVWDRTEPPNFCEECGAHIRKAVAR